VAEWRVPCPTLVDGREVTGAGVIRAEYDETPRQLRKLVERRRDVAAVHQARVRHDAAEKPRLRIGNGIGAEAGRDLCLQAVGRAFAERTGTGGRAGGDHGLT